MDFFAVSLVVDIERANLNGADSYTKLQLITFAFKQHVYLKKKIIAINITVVTNCWHSID